MLWDSSLDNDDHETLLTIQSLLGGNVWDKDLCTNIAAILDKAGYTIADLPAL